MKKIFQFGFLMFALITLGACKDDDRGLVVSQDNSYQMDEDYIHVDIPDEFIFDDSNILYIDGKTLIKMIGSVNEEGTTIKGATDFKFKVKLKRALPQSLVVNFKLDDSLLENFPELEGMHLFPNECYNIGQATIDAGQTEAEIALSITNIQKLTESGYVLPLVIQTAETEGLHNSVQWYSLIVQLDLEKSKKNVSDKITKVEGTRFNDIITFESNTSDGLSKLNDGNLWRRWYPEKNTYLTMSLPTPQVIKGITFVIDEGAWGALGQFKLYVKEADGSYYYGQIKRPRNSDGYLHVTFKEPVAVRSVRMEELRDVDGGTGPAISEIWFVK